MTVHGELKLRCAPAELWRRFSEPSALAETLPGTTSFEVLSPDSLIVHLEPDTSLGITPWRLELDVVERREAEHLIVQGIGWGAEYAVALNVEIDFESDGPSTRVRWRAEAEFDGVLSSVGQRVLPAIVAAQIRQALQAADNAAALRA